MKIRVLRSLALALFLSMAHIAISAQVATQANPANGAAVKQLGSIRAISGADLRLATDQGVELAVKVQGSARILRLAPGQTDLKSATAIQLSDLQVGDRVLVRGKLGENGVTLEASAVIVMKQQDIAQKQQQDLLDWQRRSVGGLVKKVDAPTNAITLSVSNKTVVVTVTPKTTFKRYAPDSVKWEDAVAAKLDEVHSGDQLRAKGNKNEDGTQLAAEEIVVGTFRNISGLISAVDSAQGTLTVQDLATKKTVTVKVSADSQMKNLPPQLAQGLAMRMKSGANPTAAPAGVGNGEAGHSRGDLNQLLARLPAATLADLHKGEAVMIVSTEGSATQAPVAITLLGGVEAILTASPGGSGVQSFLTPWSLAGAPGGDQ